MMNLFEAACAQAIQHDIYLGMKKVGIDSIISTVSRLDCILESLGVSSDDLSVVSLERQWRRERNPVAKLNLAREIFHRKGGRR